MPKVVVNEDDAINRVYGRDAYAAMLHMKTTGKISVDGPMEDFFPEAAEDGVFFHNGNGRGFIPVDELSHDDLQHFQNMVCTRERTPIDRETCECKIDAKTIAAAVKESRERVFLLENRLLIANGHDPRKAYSKDKEKVREKLLKALMLSDSKRVPKKKTISIVHGQEMAVVGL